MAVSISFLEQGTYINVIVVGINWTRMLFFILGVVLCHILFCIW